MVKSGAVKRQWLAATVDTLGFIVVSCLFSDCINARGPTLGARCCDFHLSNEFEPRAIPTYLLEFSLHFALHVLMPIILENSYITCMIKQSLTNLLNPNKSHNNNNNNILLYSTVLKVCSVLRFCTVLKVCRLG